MMMMMSFICSFRNNKDIFLLSPQGNKGNDHHGYEVIVRLPRLVFRDTQTHNKP
jgi:hypothetical protein